MSKSYSKKSFSEREFEYYTALLALKKQGVKSINGLSIENAITMLRG